MGATGWPHGKAKQTKQCDPVPAQSFASFLAPTHSNNSLLSAPCSHRRRPTPSLVLGQAQAELKPMSLFGLLARLRMGHASDTAQHAIKSTEPAALASQQVPVGTKSRDCRKVSSAAHGPRHARSNGRCLINDQRECLLQLLQAANSTALTQRDDAPQVLQHGAPLCTAQRWVAAPSLDPRLYVPIHL